MDKSQHDQVVNKLICWMLDVTFPHCPDAHHEGYMIYHIECGEIGFSISASKDSGKWIVRDFSTYNAE